MDDIILCAEIAVECVKNDPEAINNGEPKYLGFVFYVKRNEADGMIQFIRETLDALSVPYEDVCVFRSISMPLVRVWDKESIEARIRRDANYFIEEKRKRKQGK